MDETLSHQNSFIEVGDGVSLSVRLFTVIHAGHKRLDDETLTVYRGEGDGRQKDETTKPKKTNSLHLFE